MAVTYPLALPAGKRMAVTVRQHDQVAASASRFTGQTQVQAHAGQWWEMDVMLRPLTRAEAAAWMATFAALRGRFGTFHLGDSSRPAPLGTGAGAPLVAGAGQTGQTLVTDGWGVAQTVLKAGDYLQVGSGALQRLYLATEDVVSDGAGGATVSIWPALRESPADNAPLVLTNPAGTFRLAENTREWSVDRALHWGIGFSAVEAL